jgi:hypothetical protein
MSSHFFYLNTFFYSPYVTLSVERMGPVVYDCCWPSPAHSQVRVKRDSWPHSTVSDLTLHKPGGPGPRIYIAHEQGGPAHARSGPHSHSSTALNCQSQSQSQSYITTDGQSTILSWCVYSPGTVWPSYTPGTGFPFRRLLRLARLRWRYSNPTPRGLILTHWTELPASELSYNHFAQTPRKTACIIDNAYSPCHCSGIDVLLFCASVSMGICFETRYLAMSMEGDHTENNSCNTFSIVAFAHFGRCPEMGPNVTIWSVLE